MKKIFLFLLVFISIKPINAQSSKTIDIEVLYNLAEKSVFSSLVKFTSQLEYVVLDSSKDEKGSIFYYTREPKLYGNVLACTTDKTAKKIDMLTFTTYNNEKYIELKDQLKKLGFTSSGIHKSNRHPITESQDFERKEITVATAVRKEDGITTYEFTFLKL